MRMKSLYCLILTSVFFATAGCTHQMQVTNLQDYQVAQISGTGIDVAVASTDVSGDEALYFNAIVEALRRHPHVDAVRTNWSHEKVEERFSPCYMVSLDVTPTYEGSGDNWIITWPGCYIFTCAWAGYRYHVNAVTDMDIVPLERARETMLKCGVTPQQHNESLTCDFDLRHCDFARGFWSGSGWWMPGFGLHNIIVGIFFTEYEPKATQPFHQAADRVYGDYIANKIVENLVTGGAEKYAQAIRE